MFPHLKSPGGQSAIRGLEQASPQHAVPVSEHAEALIEYRIPSKLAAAGHFDSGNIINLLGSPIGANKDAVVVLLVAVISPAGKVDQRPHAAVAGSPERVHLRSQVVGGT